MPHASGFIACDLDLVLLDNTPENIVAGLDYKARDDILTRTEHMCYGSLSKHFPIYVVCGDDPVSGAFSIYRYIDRNSHGPIFITQNWEEFEAWERELRLEHSRKENT